VSFARPIAFSTSWNSGRHTSGDEMLREIKALGFDLIELGHGIRISLMPGIQKMFEAGEARFSSLHNFCPLPVEVMSASPDCYEMSSPDKRERDRAVKQTLQTIDFAERLHAPFVVLHCGSVRMNPITDELVELARNDQLLSRKYVRKKVNAVKTREQRAPVHLDRVKECLKPIIERAAEKKIRLGIEGRRGYEEIPSERELPKLLDEMAAPNTGYWHDMGHIQVKENLGFLEHAEWLREIAPRSIGCHMQDVKWPAQDHQPPFLGDMKNLEALTRMLPQDCQIVWELSPRRTADEIAQSLALWKERLGDIAGSAPLGRG
jgi:sugar phosphate isomerase/epimerase